MKALPPPHCGKALPPPTYGPSPTMQMIQAMRTMTMTAEQAAKAFSEFGKAMQSMIKIKSRRGFFGNYVHCVVGMDPYVDALARYKLGVETSVDLDRLAELHDDELPFVTFFLCCARIRIAVRRFFDEVFEVWR